VLLLPNKDREYNNPVASFAICLSQAKCRTWANYAVTLSVSARALAVTTLPCWVSRSFIRPCLHV